LTRKSLAKYVVAEAPTDVDISDVLNALGPNTPRINHVGVLYALLGVVFATAEQIEQWRNSDDAWDTMVSCFAELAYTQAASPQAAAAEWHLPDSAFVEADLWFQAEPSDWQVSGVQVHRVIDRDDAHDAIRAIALQGEGSKNSPDSHFERFLSIFRGTDGVLRFPTDEWVPTRNLPTDPTPAGCANENTRRWMELADASYALLIGLVEHYLVADPNDRELLVGWIFAEMRTRLGYLARDVLTTLPTGGPDRQVAGMPFTLPTPIHLPGTEAARWLLHQRRTEAAIDKIGEIQNAGGATAEAHKPYLDAQLTANKDRVTFLAARAAPRPFTTSFTRDIAPLFRPVVDIQHMRDQTGVDLSVREVVVSEAAVILERLRSTDPHVVMPKPPYLPWTHAQIELFARWDAEGHPE
jgi:hypothetical protein